MVKCHQMRSMRRTRDPRGSGDLMPDVGAKGILWAHICSKKEKKKDFRVNKVTSLKHKIVSQKISLHWEEAGATNLELEITS